MRQPCRLAAGCLATEPSRRLFDRPGCVLGARDPLRNRIAACLPNDLPIVVAFHGAMRLGAICVGIPTALSTPEKLRLLSHCDPQLLLTDPQTASQLAEENSPAQPLPPVLIADPAGLSDNWGPALAARHRAPTVNIDPHAPAGIAYTSGTTGSPKGIVHSQHNLLLPGAMLVTTRNYGPQLRKGDCLPLTILNLMALTTLLTAQAGGLCALTDRRDAGGLAEWIRDTKVTLWNGVPTQLRDLVQRSDIDAADLASLSEVWCGGADLPAQPRRTFRAKFGIDIRATYGLTEAPPSWVSIAQAARHTRDIADGRCRT